MGMHLAPFTFTLRACTCVTSLRCALLLFRVRTETTTRACLIRADSHPSLTTTSGCQQPSEGISHKSTGCCMEMEVRSFAGTVIQCCCRAKLCSLPSSTPFFQGII